MNTWNIRTKIIPATDTTGTRVRAACNGRTKSIPYPYELSGEEVHRKAAQSWIDWHMSRNDWADTSCYKLKTHWDNKRGYSFEILKNTL
jgi:hypothetical protein